MQKVYCPKCHQEYEIDEIFFGTDAQCAICNTVFTVNKPTNMVALRTKETDELHSEITPSKKKRISIKMRVTFILIVFPILFLVVYIYAVKVSLIKKQKKGEETHQEQVSSLPFSNNTTQTIHTNEKDNNNALRFNKGESEGNSNRNDLSKKIITEIAGIQFGSAPRSKATLSKDIYEYSLREKIKTDSSLFQEVFAYYTPISKQLFCIESDVGYENLRKVANLFTEKYGNVIEFKSDYYTLPIEHDAYTYTFTKGSTQIGDAIVFFKGEKKEDNIDKNFRPTISKGIVRISNRPIVEIYLMEYQQTQEYKKDKQEEENRKIEEIKAKEEKLRREKEQHQKELEDI